MSEPVRAVLLFADATRLKAEALSNLLTRILRDAGESRSGAVAPTLVGVGAETSTLSVTLETGVLADRGRLTLTVAARDGAEVASEKLQARLAALAWQLLTRVPATEVAWLDHAEPLPRTRFLEALAPALGRAAVTPRRCAPTTAATTLRPRRAVRAAPTRAAANETLRPGDRRADAHVRAFEAHLRRDLVREASEAELAAAAPDGGSMPTEARLATWAVTLGAACVSLPVAAPVLVMNVMQGEDFRAASLVMGLAGLFAALDTTGALASVLPG